MRLACVRHAASVNSEPGSNSPVLLGVFPHSDSLFSFQRASFGAYYCSNSCAVVKGFVFPSRFLPPRAATDFVTQPGFRVNPSVRFFYRPAGINPAAFQATVIYIQSPPPCQAPFQLPPLCKRGARGDFNCHPWGSALQPIFLLLPPP